MKATNRIALLQADYLLMLVRRPPGWQPKSPYDVPPEAEVLSVDYVASFAEAKDDLLRSNRLSLKKGLDEWVVVQSGGGEL